MTEFNTSIDPITKLPYASQPEEEPFWPSWEGIKAGAELENAMWKAGGEDVPGSEFFEPRFHREDNYDPFTDPAIVGHEPKHFIESGSRAQTKWIVDRINYNRDLLEKADITGRMVGVFTNPVLMIPALITGGTSTGVSVGAGIARFAAVESGAEILNETILHSQQPLRTMEESAWNVGMTVGASSLFYVGGRAIANSDWAYRRGARPATREAATRAYNQMLKEHPADLTASQVNAEIREIAELQLYGPRRRQEIASGSGKAIGQVAADEVIDERSVGAREAGVETTLEQETMVKPGFAETVSLGPLAGVLQSASLKARQLVQKLTYNPFLMRKSQQGIASPQSIEGIVDSYGGIVRDSDRALNDAYAKYRKGTPSPLGRLDFTAEVTKAMKAGDVHSNPYIQQAARSYRKKITPIIKELKRHGLFPDIPIASFFPRMFNIGHMMKNYDGIRDDIIAAMKRSPEYDSDLDGAVDEIMHRITGGQSLETAVGAVLGRYPAVAMMVTDDLLSPYALTNAQQAIHQFIRVSAHQLAERKALNGSTIREEISAVSAEFDELIASAKSSERAKLQKERKETIESLNAVGNRVMGHNYRPVITALDSTAAAAKAVVAATKLGGVVATSITDLGTPLLVTGLKPYLRAIVASMGRIFGDTSLKMSKAEMRRIGVGVDDALHGSTVGDLLRGGNSGLTGGTRFNSLADVGAGPGWAQGLQALSAKYINFIEPWTNVARQYAGAMSMHAVLKAATKRGGPTTRQVSAGMNKELMNRIATQFDQYGTKGTLWRSNLDKWDDQTAREAFLTIVHADVNNAVITPTAGDKWLALDAPVISTLFQFKSFMVSAHNRILVRGLQQPDARFWTGIVGLAFMSYMSLYVKGQFLSKDSKYRIDNMDADAALEAIVYHSGMLGLFSIPAEYARPMIEGEFGKYEASRASAELFGPLVSTIKDTALAAAGLREGDFKPASKLVPIPIVGNLQRLIRVVEAE